MIDYSSLARAIRSHGITGSLAAVDAALNARGALVNAETVKPGDQVKCVKPNSAGNPMRDGIYTVLAVVDSGKDFKGREIRCRQYLLEPATGRRAPSQKYLWNADRFVKV